MKKKATTKRILNNTNTELTQNIILSLLLDVLKDDSDSTKENFKKKFSEFFIQEISKINKIADYNILIIYDDSSLSPSHSDKIYKALSKLDSAKPLILILHSGGGYPGPAYLIGKLCKKFSENKFIVVVPRYAKSAATLLSCGADEIHMGQLSELGPIDPQINNMPTLGLKNAVEHIAELVSQYPNSSELFAKYLSLTIKPISIGHYERVAESSAQYAVRLLEKNGANLKNKPDEIAYKLVYGYKDHGFVIDQEEAESIFGSEVVKNDTIEYEIGNIIYNLISNIEHFILLFYEKFSFVGDVNSSIEFFSKK